MDNNSLVDFLVVSNIAASSKEEVIKALVANLEEKNYLYSKAVFLNDVLERENTLSTYIGHEIGLPHSQSEGVKTPTVTVGRLAQPVKWTDEGDEVNTTFLISVPKKNEDSLHLKILSKLARLLMHESFRSEIRNIDEENLVEILNQKLRGA
ncbi:PTS sugar transporter subunit IIA [Niallia nealsonii]|uniref:PTS fructose transporter subunit IIA n=1 Tax=Niallia nealsonii TaxID=115979 RepID=A0A2N0Z0F3_9BACI|nr:fructose PTS transporter subunit IIA [Niallia nealsonii]PKG22979.1 PTS fructose transporter subunit IIA [Niallia nealsonii]